MCITLIHEGRLTYWKITGLNRGRASPRERHPPHFAQRFPCNFKGFAGPLSDEIRLGCITKCITSPSNPWPSTTI